MINMNMGERSRQLLDGDWGLLPDVMGRAEQQSWWKSTRRPGEFFPSYDDDAFWPTRVPAAFNRIHDTLTYYEGQVVYLHHFRAALPGTGERCLLHFEGVADRCRVFLNGRWIGEHDGGFVPFTLDATPALAEQNRLLVYVDNARRADAVPGLRHDWWHDGGIHRPVSLVRVPACHVREAGVVTRLCDREVELEFAVLIHDSRRDRERSVECTIGDAASGEPLALVRLNASGGCWSRLRLRLPRDRVRLWQPDAPHLYRLEVKVGDDCWCDHVGLREVTTRGRDILLNGEPVILRGVCTWTEDPDRGIFSMSETTAATTVALLQELNCNFARAGHCPPSREFVRACDRAGILLWAEVPAYWMPTMHKPTENRRALHTLDAMVRSFRNRASVVIWCIGNECLHNEVETGQSNLGYFLEAADMLHESDPSRLVTYTSGSGSTGMECIYPQCLVDKLDVVAFNSYSGISDGADPDKPEEFDQHRKKVGVWARYGKPLILAEVGIDAVKGETGFDYGEARQADYHARVQKLVADTVADGTLQGVTPFVLNDFATPIKLGRYQQGYNRKGLVTETLEPKQAFAAVRDGYAKLLAAASASASQPAPCS